MRKSFVIVALALASCVPVPMLPAPPIPVAAGETPRATAEALEGEPLTLRLAQYLDGRPCRVDPASIPPHRVHVIVHGWAPGWTGHADDPAWSAERRGERFEPWMTGLAEALTERDEHAVVLFYSWLDHAATHDHLFAQRQAFAYTDVHGERLAEALDAALAPGARQLHLIGHSFGARVVGVAATRLSEPPRQVTVLDAPDTDLVSLMRTRVELASLLSRLPVGREDHQVFVDNYVSMLGVEYRYETGLGGVVDVRTAPPFGALAYGPRHRYAPRFYTDTVATGFGAGWSPLLGGTPPRGGFRQRFGEIALEPIH